MALWAVGVAALAAAPLSAETLADAARREKQRRAAAQTAATATFTERDLATRHRPGDDVPPIATAEPAAASAPASPPAFPPAMQLGAEGGWRVAPLDPSDRRDAQRRTWQRRARNAREQIQQAEKDVAELEGGLQGQVGLLVQSCSGRQTNRRTHISELDQQLEVAKARLAEARRSLEDLEEEARRSRVPPGWLRE